MWIITTLIAVLFQLGRNTASKRLSDRHSPLLVSLARFLPGIPLALAGLGIAFGLGESIYSLDGLFFIFCALMGICQAAANILLVSLFARKSFALSISLVKLETVFLALLAVPILGDSIPPLEWTGIFVAASGLVAASMGGKREDAANRAAPRGAFSRTLERLARVAKIDSLMALGSGFLLALSGIFLKLAFAHANASSPVMTVLASLPLILGIQSLLLAAFLAAKGRLAEIAEAARSPRLPGLIGLLSAVGTFFWFVSFSIASLQAVRTLGQSEFIFACAVSAVFLKESIKANEYVGIACVAAGGLIIAWA
jgi:drug/metabolite transporter (DMT)-like permease